MTEKKTIPIRGGFPLPPKHLNKFGKEAWNIGQQLWLEGSLLERDLFNWRLFAEAVQERKHCEEIVAKDGEYAQAVNGCKVQHPAIKRRQHAENVIRKYSQMYGLVPNARTKRPAVQQGVVARKRS
jgi:P27 family predicted phage terminase small subunit